MKRRFCTILMVALLVLPAASLGVAQEGTPPVPGGWGALPEDRSLAPPEDGELEGWEPPPPPTGPGAVITVTTTDDELNSDGDCALREAIQAANTDAAVDACVAGSGADTVLVPAGTYLLTIPGAGEDANQTGDLDILDNLTLNGDGAEVTILDGNSLDRLLQIHTGRTATVSDLTVTGGLVIDVRGSAIDNRGTLTLNDAIVRGNTLQSASSYGGALANSAVVQDATAYVNYSLIAENTAPCSAGLSNAAGTGLTAALHLDHTSVLSNTAAAFAGGVYNGQIGGTTDSVSILTLTDSLVAGNSALGMGYVGGGGILSLGQETANRYAWLTLERTTVRDNTVTNEPGLQGGKGAGVAIWQTTTTVVDSTISGNTGTGVGGVQPAVGGGLAIWDSAVTLSNTTVSGNEVLGEAGGSGAGGGIMLATNDAPASLTLLNVTLAGNSADLEGGAIAGAKVSAFTPVVTFKNTLIAGNTAPQGPSCFGADFGYGPPEFTSLGHNLEDYDTCEFDQPSDWPDTDPILGPLQDNGGDTWTHALLEGSLARDHGDDAACPPTDQRGVARPQGPHCDIGAFEAYPDENAPAVMAVSPPHEAADVALDATLVITFSEPISVPTFAYSVSPDPGGWAESWGPNHTVVSLTHDPFDLGTTYTATVTAAEDRAGNPLAEAFEWAITTPPCEAVQIVTVTTEVSGCLVSFSAELSGTPPFDYLWDLGAMGTYTGTNPVVDLGTDGTYPYTLTVANCGGAYSDTHSSEVTVSCLPTFRIYLPLVVRDSG